MLPKKIVFFGHSWVRQLAELAERGKLDDKAKFDGINHTASYVHEIKGKRIYMIEDALMNFQDIFSATGYCHVICLFLGGNDVAQHPGRISFLAKRLVFLATKLWNTRVAERVVIVQSAPRLGKNAFRRTNVDFHPDFGVSREDGESLYIEKLEKFHQLIKEDVQGHPDIHFLPLKGMYYQMSDWLKPGDGKHLSKEGVNKLHLMINQQTIGISAQNSITALTGVHAGLNVVQDIELMIQVDALKPLPTPKDSVTTELFWADF